MCERKSLLKLLLISFIILLFVPQIPIYTANAQATTSCLKITPANTDYYYYIDVSKDSVQRITQPETLTPDSYLIAPDERHRAIRLQQPCNCGAQPFLYHLYIESEESKKRTQLEENHAYIDYQWSPSSTHLLYWGTDSNDRVYLAVTTPDGQDIQQRFVDDAELFVYGWSANSAWIAYALLEQKSIKLTFWSVADGQTVEHTIPVSSQQTGEDNDTSGTIQGVWSPVHPHFAFNILDQMFILGIDNTGVKQLVEQTFTGNKIPENVELFWSPDGNYVGRFVYGDFGAEQDAYRDLIDVVGIDGTVHENITENGDYISFSLVDWLPTSQQIVLGRLADTDVNGYYDIWVYDLTQQKNRLLIPGMSIFYSGGYGPPSPNTGDYWLSERKEQDHSFTVEVFDRPNQRRIPIVQNASELLYVGWRRHTEQVLVVWSTGKDATLQVYVTITDRNGKVVQKLTNEAWRDWTPWGWRISVRLADDDNKIYFLLKKATGTTIEGVDLLTEKHFVFADETAAELLLQTGQLINQFSFISPNGERAASVSQAPGENTGKLILVIPPKAQILDINAQMPVYWSFDSQWLLLMRDVEVDNEKRRHFEVLDVEGKSLRSYEFDEEQVSGQWVVCQ